MFERDENDNIRVEKISQTLTAIFQTESYIWNILIRDTTHNNQLNGQINVGLFSEKLG